MIFVVHIAAKAQIAQAVAVTDNRQLATDCATGFGLVGDGNGFDLDQHPFAYIVGVGLDQRDRTARTIAQRVVDGIGWRRQVVEVDGKALLATGAGPITAADA